MVGELLKARLHRGLEPRLWHYRESRCAEVDLLVHDGSRTVGVEVKSGATVAGDWLGPPQRFGAGPTSGSVERRLVYGGQTAGVRSGVTVLPWMDVASADWWLA